jgi:hypothetical protein
VVIGGRVTRKAAGFCPDLLKLQPVSVNLAGPLGGRVILDALSGKPLTVTATR